MEGPQVGDLRQCRTEARLAALVRDARPVERLAAVRRHLAVWLVVAVASSGSLVLAFGLRPDLADRLSEERFRMELGAALATSIMAAVAALSAVRPGRPWWERWLGLPPLMVWLATLGEGCWRWLVARDARSSFEIDPVCLPYIMLIGFIPATALVMLVRKGAPVHPRLALFNAALAAAALGAAALRLFHQQDASVMILVWQVGSVAVLALMGGALGRSMLRWPHEAK